MQTINLESHLQELSDRGWVLLAVPEALHRPLAELAIKRFQKKDFRTAGISADQNKRPEIRNDQIFWLDAKTPDLETLEQKIFAELDSLKNTLQEYFRVHVAEFECHYAIYEPGHFYQRHTDSTQTNNKRVFSFVLYLNENWREEDAGFLVGYEQEKVLFKIKPEAGTMILFKSDVEHEVQKTNRQRLTLTGWFRR